MRLSAICFDRVPVRRFAVQKPGSHSSASQFASSIRSALPGRQVHSFRNIEPELVTLQQRESSFPSPTSSTADSADEATSRRSSTGRADMKFSAVQLCALVVLGMSLFLAPAADATTSGLQERFYRHSCPHVETIVYNSMAASYKKDKTVAPGVLRIAFHDCFVRGCDASVLLLGPDTERAAFPNSGLHGFEAVDAAKKAVEKACPGVVSAADVLQFAARDSVILAGGHGWRVPAGRRDGRVSKASETTPDNLPSPFMDASALLRVFKSKGLDAAQLVILSGAHTIGVTPCGALDDRLQTAPVDPTLPASLAKSLKKQCPKPRLPTRVNLDVSTPHKFDPKYFKNLIDGRGLLTSDVTLIRDSRTRRAVYANNGDAFYRNFGRAMAAMSRIGVLTGRSGEIRRVYDRVN